MKTQYTKVFMFIVFVAMVLSANAQTVNVPFSTKAAGKSLPIEWGMDAAWDWDYNVMRGIAHYGTNFTTGRISFQPYNLVDASKINDASANFGLSAGQVRKLQWRIDLIKRTGATKVNINCDQEVLVRAMDDEGNYGKDSKVGEVNDYVGKGNYVSTDGSTYKTTEWVNLIKATVKYAQAQGLEVISVSPFNESDYGWEQYYNGQGGTSTTNQDRYGIPTFKAIAQAIKEDPFFDGIRVCGGNTLNCDRASAWYEGLKPYVDEGNTHQLAGSFDNYANFFSQVRADGKVATADEVHNVGEAMVGVEYGMQNAIWWGFDSKARGQFMHDSNEGVRLGYAEDRSRWTTAAVYRNDKDNEIHGFIGSSERQANESTYNFQCQDREVYFNGYGPQKEWSVTTVGGASNSYQNGQINYERLFDITYGEDVQSAPIDGNYQIMSAADMKLVTSNGYWADNNHLSAAPQVNNNTQRWHVYPGRSDGDCSYWFVDNVGDATQHWNLLNGGGAGALAAGSRVICYNANHDALEQWYLRYAKDGYFYIMARQSNKYLYNENGTLTLQDAPTKSTGASALKKYMWRLMPTDAIAEQTAPGVPSQLVEGATTSTSANISWAVVTGESKTVTYNVLRQDANGWNTIARLQSGTSYTDTKVEAGKAYRYKVQAVDYSGNRSDVSDVIMIMVPEDNTDAPEYTAGEWEWVGETAAAGNYYIYNKANNVFLKKTSAVDVDPTNATLFTLSGTSNATISYSDNGTKYVYESEGNQSWGTTNTNKWTIQSKTDGYYIYHTDPGYSGWFGATRTRYISLSNSAVSYAYQNFTDANRLLQFISENQISKYQKVSDYAAAFNIAKGYLTADVSSSLKKELIGTLDACYGTINFTNIEQYITDLNAIAKKCENYSSGEVEDFTDLIINPTVIQNGGVTDLPNGWYASKHQTDNDHYTQGTGNTRLEAWTGNNDIDVDYYQDIILPNGLYMLTADTHQDADGNACIYGETYKSFETKMNVGNGIEHEATSSVENILVTDGSLRIGMKICGPHNWITADNFILTRISSPENTALSHYTDAIAYLNNIAEAELVRNIDHTELMLAYTSANKCEANAAAYEVAINNLVAAIEKSKNMVAAEPALSGSWIGQTGNYGDAAERYNWDNPYPAGRILYQVVEDLIPGAQYEIEFYAVANVARNLDANLYSGSGIAYLFANSTEEDIDIIYQDGCTPTDFPRTLRAVADANGQIAYGIANRKAGGQWYVAKAKSITLLDNSYTALLRVNPNKYGTFVAPFAVTLPEGITAYSALAEGNTAKLLKVAEAGGVLNANTPVILRNTTDEVIEKSYSGVSSTEKTRIEGNGLVGFLAEGLIIPQGAYVLQTQEGTQAFYVVRSAFFGTKNRCYLQIPASESDARLRIAFDDEETIIEGLVEPSDEQTEYYSLDGLRLTTPKRGFNIVRQGNSVRKVFVR